MLPSYCILGNIRLHFIFALFAFVVRRRFKTAHAKEYRITVFFSVRVSISNCVGRIKTERNRLQVIKGEKRNGAKITLFTVYQCDLRNLVIWLKNSFQSFLSFVTNKQENNSVESEGKRKRKLNYAV